MAEYTTSKPEWAPDKDDENKFACGVMSGIEGITDTTIGNLNPALKNGTMKPKRKMVLSVDDYVKGVSAGDRVTLARAITLIESNNPKHFSKAQQVLQGLLPKTGKALRIGITGVPGAGKSTTIEAFGNMLCDMGHRVAVLAVDPTSSVTRGSILGDKTRMEKLSVHPDAFIRPSPSAGSLGGVARKTRETIVLCEAAGFDKIFVENVGVGQSETAVHSMVDFFLLIQLAGTGDELQGIKRGIMEMADGIVINKADGDNIDRARLAQAQFRNALHLFPLPPSGWTPEVLTYSGYYEIGIPEVWDMIYRYFDFVKKNGYFEEKRRQQEKYWMYESINEHLKAHFYNNPVIEEMLAAKQKLVLEAKQSSFMAAADVLNYYFSNK